MLGSVGPDFVIEPFRATDVVSTLRLLQRSIGQEVPYSFLLQMASLRPEYCKIARETITGRVVGLIIGTKESGHGARILLFAVDPTAQGHGVGHGLMNALQNSMAIEDVRQVELEVRTDNQRAIDFYQRHGFQVEGLQERAYEDGADAYLMRKPLL